MAKEVTISTWCDPCMSTGERVVATQSVIMELSLWTRPLEIDVCDDHFQILSDVDAMMNKHGRVADKTPASEHHSRTKLGRKPTHDLVSDPMSVGCPVCLKLYSGKGTNRMKYVGQHIRVQHAPLSIKEFSDDQLARATAEAKAKIADHGA